MACTLDTSGGTSAGSSAGDGSGSVGTTTEAGGSGTLGGSAGSSAAGGSTGEAEQSTGVDDTAGAQTSSEASTGPCMQQPWYPDGDGDGFGEPGGEVLECDPPPDHVGQAGDCDDADGAINPGADELCNGQDDDCDGLTDEGSALNSACNGCQFLLAADGSRWFAVCGGAETWEQARTSCLDAFGPAAELARIDAEPDQNALLAVIGGADHWLSLNDLAREGTWRWHDDSLAYMAGVPVGFDGWRFDQPVFGNGERCGELDPGGWADAGCTQTQPRICEHPP